MCGVPALLYNKCTHEDGYILLSVVSDIIYVISVLFLLCFRGRLVFDSLSSSTGKGLTYWLTLRDSVNVLYFG